MSFHLDQNLTDQRRNRVDRIRQDKTLYRTSMSFSEAGQNALANGPERFFAGQFFQRRSNEGRQHIIELANQALVRTDHDDANRTDVLLLSWSRDKWLVQVDTRNQSELYGSIILIEGAHRVFILSDTGRCHGLHGEIRRAHV